MDIVKDIVVNIFKDFLSTVFNGTFIANFMFFVLPIVIALKKISGHLADISEDIENISDLKIEEKVGD